jgi:hypothetical protein
VRITLRHLLVAELIAILLLLEHKPQIGLPVAFETPRNLLLAGFYPRISKLRELMRIAFTCQNGLDDIWVIAFCIRWMCRLALCTRSFRCRQYVRIVRILANPGIVSWFVFTIFAGAPEIQPQSLGHPSLWRGRFEPIRLIHVGWEARKAPVDAVVFFLDFPSYRTYQEPAFRVCDHHGFAE